MKIKPVFNSEREEVVKLSVPAEYARNLYHDGMEMAMALREANRLYGADIHKIASELGIRGGKFRKWRKKRYGNED